MAWFRKKGKVFVLGLDGVPYSFLKAHTEHGDLPHLAEIFKQGTFRRMNSVYPTVSSVAWSSYMTGKNPGGHGIFGFVDRTPNPFDIFIPTAKHMKADTLWEMLSRRGKKVIVINVPVTYPPKPVSGILIGGFLGTDINKIGYPPPMNAKLKAMKYRIDVDAWAGRKEDKSHFLEDLHFTLDKRLEVAKHLMETEPWDFFQLHIMETDRINHFLWEHYEQNDVQYAPDFLEFYRTLDGWVGKMVQAITQKHRDAEIVILSDHGFCTVKKEVYLNHWLEEKGYLKFRTKEPKDVRDMSSDTRAYSLIPGRVFVNLKGREEGGSVERSQYESLRDELSERLPTAIVDPDSGEQVIEKVIKREEIYSGPRLEEAADLIAIPYDGYDLKGNVGMAKLVHKGELVGMHTFYDAMLYIRGEEIVKEDLSIVDLMPTILQFMGVPAPMDLDGTSCIKKL